MEAPYKVTGQQPHVTVLLSNSFSDTYKPFHCVGCGNVVFSYNEDEIRTILTGGKPQLDKAGKIYQCNGVMKLRSEMKIYNVLWEVMESAMNIPNIEDLHTAITYMARDSQETNARCKMLYYVS